jgi:hypothetical protein
MRSATPEFCWPFHFCNGVIYKVELLCAVVFILFPGGPHGYLSNVKEVAFASASHLSALMRQREIGRLKLSDHFIVQQRASIEAAVKSSSPPLGEI